MAETKPFFQRIARGAIPLAYGLAAAWFLWVCAQFYLPGKGFTYLVMFGEKEHERFLPELKALNHYEIPESSGYDGAYYAQLAMRPQLGDPALQEAMDLRYRARRILFSWTAYGLALGDPARALHIYAVQNIVCWLLLAALLLRWFPPNGWDNFFRWAGMLFSFGLCFSVRGALVDGPSLLLIAGGVALAEMGRPWWSAALLGVSGLGKETNVLAGAALAPAGGARRDWLTAIGRIALVALPLAIWLVTLKLWLGEAMNTGFRNFAPPFVGYIGKCREIAALLSDPSRTVEARGSILLVVVLTTHFLFFALRPRWRETWWRVGAVYAVLMMLLGEAVWEGYPGAASRVLLPMALAFNILVPRRPAGWLLLVLGNITFLLAPDTLEPAPREAYDVSGPRALRIAEAGSYPVEAVFDANWYGPERSWREVWNWSRGSATVTVRNPQPFPLVANLTFGVRANSARHVSVVTGGRTLWHAQLGRGELARVQVAGVVLPPGETVLRFETDSPGARTPNGDPRELAFSLRDLKIELTGRAGER